MKAESHGRVITFYSYKGGTGRSMALANVGCLLAQRRLGPVLVVDWDLEAPGLHRYFRPFVTGRFPNTDDGQRSFDQHPGLIDLFLRLDSVTRSQEWGEERDSEEAVEKLISSLDLDQFIFETDINSLYFLKAGSFDETYGTKVNTFQWADFYDRSPSLIRAIAEKLTERFSYVLIDSRTGLTDISGICTTLMPEVLVVVFTPNVQSLTGVLDLIRSATDYRKESADLRPLTAFPLASRIDATYTELRDMWRFGNTGRGIVGYQPQFEELFTEVYDLPQCNLERYFDEVQIQHTPDYAYGEQIAVRVERGGDRFSLSRSYQSFTDRLVSPGGPWEDLTRVEGPARFSSTAGVPGGQEAAYQPASTQFWRSRASVMVAIGGVIGIILMLILVIAPPLTNVGGNPPPVPTPTSFFLAVVTATPQPTSTPTSPETFSPTPAETPALTVTPSTFPTFTPAFSRPPVLTLVGDQRIVEGSTLIVPISASDPDGDSITLTTSGLPAFADLIPQGNGRGILRLNPGLGDAGTYTGGVITASDRTSADQETITIIVDPRQFFLTVNCSGPGSVSPQHCGTTMSYFSGEQVSLTATPDAGWTFTGWSPSAMCSGTDPCTVTILNSGSSIETNVAVTAIFTQAQRSLSLLCVGSGSASPQGCGTTQVYFQEEEVKITATPASGWQFDSWSGACSGSRDCVVTLDSDKSVTATFNQVQRSLTLLCEGSGSVGKQSCGTTQVYSSGSQVTLSATPFSGWRFVGWSGACSGAGGCTVVMDTDKSVTAQFDPVK